ncbi:MAG TPA: class I SAM-dependent RNA methyltransferase [Terriglobia bacterium]|nr:class I SAM-dependent RNA methyltransferase [Terriglobia bacterium]
MPAVKTFEMIPQKLVFGGAALGHYNGRAVLVPNALPGEHVEVEPLRETKGVIHGRLRRVVIPSPARLRPPCPYFGNCGGCSYQHLAAENQLAWKLAIFRETLSRIGKLKWDSEIAVHSAYPWYYRNQARLRVGRAAEGKAEMGFFALESHRLVKVDACPILSPRLNATLTALSEMASRSSFEGVSAIEMMADDCDRSVMLRLCGRVSPGQGERLASAVLTELPQVQTVAFEADGKRRILGEPFLRYRVGDFTYQISSGSFFQASRFLLPDLVRTVSGMETAPADAGCSAPAAKHPNGAEIADNYRRKGSSCALDLYAGAGLFTLPLARHFNQVIAVESHSGSAGDLKANVRASTLGNARAVNQSVFDFLRRFAACAPDFVVLDPPRAGVGYPALKLLARLRPKSICYVSCHPPTLARDLSFLAQQGYTIISMELFDFFPQTLHLESVTRLGTLP